jgi:hypothetical protein
MKWDWKRLAKMYRTRSRVDREDREVWKRIAQHFAEWSTAFQVAITAGDIKKARALAEQFRKHGSSEKPRISE